MSSFAQAIVAHLTHASNSATALAIGWHVVGAMAVVALLCGWRPSNRRAGRLLAAPIASAAGVAFYFGNPFNAAILTALALALLVLVRGLDRNRITSGRSRTTAAGVLMIVFGAVYPHFLATESALAYLYAAPIGVVPCPTLSVVVGVTLCANGFGSRAWCLVIAAAGLFYGIVGVALLGVSLDAVLVAGAVLVVFVAFLDVPPRRSRLANLADPSRS